MRQVLLRRKDIAPDLYFCHRKTLRLAPFDTLCPKEQGITFSLVSPIPPAAVLYYPGAVYAKHNTGVLAL